MRKLMLIAGVVLATVVAATSGWAAAAKHIVGTSRNEVLRGTAKADILDGRGGNDRLLGLAGNDVLIGGPGRDVLVGGAGRDRLRCGPGNDTARADASDIVAGDCEVVTGVPTSEPPPAPPPPTAQIALPGRYCGYTNAGKIICVTVAPDSRRVTAYSLSSEVDCGTMKRTFSFAQAGPALIEADLSFAHSHDGALPDRPALKNIHVAYEVSGKFDTAGNASGMFWLSRLSFDSTGSHFDCTGSPSGWQAKLGP